MKKIIPIICIIMLLLTACGKKEEITKTPEPTPKAEIKQEQKSVVLYFSATGTTEKIAKNISSILNSDIYEIVPKESYTENDLKYQNSKSRASIEQQNKDTRPEIKNDINIDSYDRVYIGYPIWFGTHPRIIMTLIDNIDFKDKEIILFCTSGSSNIESSIQELRTYNTKLNILGGTRLKDNINNEELTNWIKTFK